jgi:outer membrane murein-binding lipoprotein Lpp
MADAFRKLGMAAALGTLLLAGGISGCSSMSTDHVDCNVVKLQAQSGRSDAEIASAIGGSEADVAKCHGPETSGNKTSTDAIPSPN